jgi:hypothetical protein
MKMRPLAIRCRREPCDSTITRAHNIGSAIIGQQPVLPTHYIRPDCTFCRRAHFTGNRNLV